MPCPYESRLFSQPSGFFFVHNEIDIRRIDSDSVDLSRSLKGYVAVTHVVEHPLRLPFERVAEPTPSGGIEAENLTRVQDMVGVA